MREHNRDRNLPPPSKHNGRLNNSAVSRRKHKRPNAQKHGVFPSLSFFPVKIRTNSKHYMPR